VGESGEGGDEVNLFEAIASGKAFRRPSWDKSSWVYIHQDSQGRHWRTWEYGPNIGLPGPDNTFWQLLNQGTGDYDWKHEDVFANDYEIQEPEVRITRTQFWEAVNADDLPSVYKKTNLVAIAKRLGLGD
jgi:hypothetical protein